MTLNTVRSPRWGSTYSCKQFSPCLDAQPADENGNQPTDHSPADNPQKGSIERHYPEVKDSAVPKCCYDSSIRRKLCVRAVVERHQFSVTPNIPHSDNGPRWTTSKRVPSLRQPIRKKRFVSKSVQSLDNHHLAVG